MLKKRWEHMKIKIEKISKMLMFIFNIIFCFTYNPNWSFLVSSKINQKILLFLCLYQHVSSPFCYFNLHTKSALIRLSLSLSLSLQYIGFAFDIKKLNSLKKTNKIFLIRCGIFLQDFFTIRLPTLIQAFSSIHFPFFFSQNNYSLIHTLWYLVYPAH